MAELSSARRFAIIFVQHLQEWSLWQSDEQYVWRDVQTAHQTSRETTPEDATHRLWQNIKQKNRTLGL